MSRTFIVQNSPSSEYALTHLVYMNPLEVGAPYVAIHRFVYRCAAHADVPQGYIAMNAVQRRENHKVAGDPIQVSDFLVPMVNFDIKSVTLKANWLEPNTNAQIPNNLANRFRTEFEGYILTKGQNLTINYEGNSVFITVMSDIRGILTMNSEVGIQWEA